MSTELADTFSLTVESTDGYNELQIERIRRSRYGSSIMQPVAAPEMLRVLVVDNHKDGARVLEILLNRWGHDCRIAVDGTRGLDLALDFRPHVVLLGMAMPRMSGAELAMTIRNDARLSDSLIIVISAHTDAASRRKCEQAGIDLYFVKPMSSLVLKSLLAMETQFLAIDGWPLHPSPEVGSPRPLTSRSADTAPLPRERSLSAHPT